MNPLVGIIMGSDSDLAVMQAASDILKQFGIAHEVTVVSAHRTPLRMVEYAQKAKEQRIKSNYCGCRRRCAFTGNGGFDYSTSCNWCSY